MKIKSLIVFLLAIASFSVSFAQINESIKNDDIKTIFRHKKGSNGGYASLWVGYSPIANKDGFEYGINGAWLMGHSVGIGLAGTGFSNDYYVGHNHGSNVRSLVGGYGGLLFEPIVFPRFPVHISFPVVLGIGAIVSMNSYYWEDWDSEYYTDDSDLFLIAQPGLDIELNLLKHMRLGLGAKYRFTTGAGLSGYSRSVLDGYTCSLSLKFGKF
jgi:hypothetical protein